MCHLACSICYQRTEKRENTEDYQGVSTRNVTFFGLDTTVDGQKTQRQIPGPKKTTCRPRTRDRTTWLLADSVRPA